MRERRVLAILAGLLIVGSVFVIEHSSHYPALSSPVIDYRDRRMAPDFKLRDSQGGEVRLSKYTGYVMLVNFWATWCKPCEMEMPWLNEFEARFRRSGFAVIGVSLDEGGWKAVAPIVEDRKSTYRIVLGGTDVLEAIGGTRGLPTTLLLDRAGRIAATFIGVPPKTVYEDSIGQLLRGR